LGVYYKLAQLTLGVMLKIAFRPWAEGARNVPQRGPAILASNHLSFADHFFGPLPLRRQVIFLAKAEYFTGRGLKGLISRAFFSALGQIPVDRGGGAASERALRTGLRVLEEGKLLGIYPEGTRSPDGRLYRGKTGIARLALEGQVPVIPCAMVGTFEFMPSGQTRPSFGIRPGVRFGEPLDFSRFYGRASDRRVLREVTDEVMRAIEKLGGQEYVDMYAQTAKEKLAAAAGQLPAGGPPPGTPSAPPAGPPPGTPSAPPAGPLPGTPPRPPAEPPETPSGTAS
jgi:1-acyl-sn-glycerol-3-phosphate acyltransferase